MAAHIDHFIMPAPKFDGAVRLLVAVSPYYKQIAEGLLTGAKRAAEAAGATVDTVEVPGALELPQVIASAAKRGLYDGYVALGCVIRGETTHYDTVCNDSSRGLMLLGIQGHAIGNGILTVENEDQAWVRADPDGQDKGGGAALAALHLIALERSFITESRDRRAEVSAVRYAGDFKDDNQA